MLLCGAHLNRMHLFKYLCTVNRYTEAIVLFKSPQDAPWHASALEGLATAAVIEAWLTGHGLVRPLIKLVHDVHSDLLDF